MKNFNWLVKLLLYKHKENTATTANTKGEDNVFYKIGYIDQVHANLCTDASENMLNHFAGRPIATMSKNTRGALEGAEYNQKKFDVSLKNINNFKEILASRGPFILALPLRVAQHSVVVFGFSDNHIIYHDPLTGGNKMLSTEELKQINGSSYIEIAIPNFFSKEIINKKRSTGLPEIYHISIPKKYRGFFTIDKMENPVQAVRSFISDYANNSLWSNRTHKEKVRAFLEETKDIDNLDQLYTIMCEKLLSSAKETQDELLERLRTVNIILAKEEKPEYNSSSIKRS